MATEPNALLGGTRALVGQGLMLGWGDEAEAWLRSKLQDTDYKDNLRRIQQEYAQYSKQYPITSAASEFGGAVAPGVAMMFVPGMQPAGAATTLGGLARLAAAAGLEGAVGGAGSAEPGRRTEGAVTGGAMGTILGPTVPVAMRGAKGATAWLRERLFPTEELAQKRATQLLSETLARRGGVTPAELEAKMAADRAAGVPSVIANVSPGTARLTRGAAKVGGEGAETIEDVLTRQKLGTRERVHQQVIKGLNPKDYYDELSSLQKDLRTKAAPLYDLAYATGEVTDPAVLGFLNRPQFKQGLKEAQHLLQADGREVDMSRPTVEMLDQVKRGIDSLIERETDAVTGKMTNKGRVYTAEKNKFLEALDTAVPHYARARSVYRGDAELLDAMRKGLNNFNSMDHEQVIKLVASMSDAEKQAFRTGVARKLYDTIMIPSGEANAAQRVFGSPEAQAKLQPLFDNPAQFELFKNAMEREAQLFKHSSRILGGSDTAENLSIKESRAGGGGVADALDRAIAGGGFRGGLAGMALTALSKGQMTEKTAARLANMLMSKDPNDVATVVKLLEEHAAQTAPKAVKAGKAEAGVTGGTVGAMHMGPAEEGADSDIEQGLNATPAEVTGPDIEADIEGSKT